jgi:hypothetical protein
MIDPSFPGASQLLQVIVDLDFHAGPLMAPKPQRGNLDGFFERLAPSWLPSYLRRWVMQFS